jgi:glucose/arabinose dehydrogenase
MHMILIAALALAQAAVPPAPAPQPNERAVAQPVSPVALQREVVARGLKHPWGMAFLPGGDLLVTEKDGGLKRIAPDGSISDIAGLPADLDNVRQDPRDNSGLFGVALHPQFRRNRLIYIAYASQGEGGTATKLVRARLGRDRLEEVKTLLLAGPRTGDRIHYGGGLVVGPDDKLYLTVGERHFNESDNPPLPVAQDIRDPRGKIYRLNLDGSIPADNPRLGRGAVPGLYALGIRAAQGIAVEPRTGRIWFSEHGSSGGDEINLLSPGANYGWPNRTSGRYRVQSYSPQAVPGAVYTEPKFVWPDRTVAPTGLTFYEGKEFPEWRGDLLVAGLRRGYLMRLRIRGGSVEGVEYLLEDAPVRLRSVRQSPAGELYVLTDEADGKVIRLKRAD